MKSLILLKLNLAFVAVTILANCSLNNDANIVKLPEMVNANTGLREVRMRRYDCLFLADGEDPLECTRNETMVSEPRKQPTNGAGSAGENLRINEQTPWLNQKARTVVNPTVMFDSTKGQMLVNLYLRIFDDSAAQFKDHKYEFVGDLKAYGEEYRRTGQRKYLNLQRKSSGTEEIVNAIVHCYDIPTCKDITLVVSFANINAKGESFVDSRPFMIDQRETEITNKNTIPNQTEATISEPIVLDPTMVNEDDIHTEGYTPDEGEDPSARLIGAPLLPPENMDGLCEGLVDASSPCPRYLLDPTLERPRAATSEDSVPETEVTHGPIKGLKTSARPKPRPVGLGVQLDTIGSPIQQPTLENENPLDVVDVTNEEIFPLEEVVLNPSIPRLQEPNLDVMPNPNTRSYEPTRYQQLLTRLSEMKEQFVDRFNELNPDATNTTNTLVRPKARPQSVTDKYTAQQAAAEEARLAAEALAEEQRLEEIRIAEEEEAANNLSPLALTSSARPLSRPANLNVNRAAGTTGASPGSNSTLIPFASIDGQFTYDLSLCGTHLVKAKNLNYRQARGRYNSGSLRNATLYNRSAHRTVYHKPGNNVKQHSSNVTKEVVEFVGCVLKQRYRDKLKSQVNNLSLRNGGHIGGQASHQNGLDVDISYPHINNTTQGFDNFAGNITNARLVAAFDQARLLIYTDRVQVLFTDNRIRRRFCNYLRDNGKLRSHREVVERYMREWRGHHDHYHVRAKCTLQNEGCVPEGLYPKTNYCG